MKYIKLNDNKNHLSLGNIFNSIKEYSINKSAAIQSEIFCIIFNVDNISETTVNNYCTGYRAIGNDYRQIFLNYKKIYSKDKSIFIETINNLISIIEGTIHNYKTIEDINNNNLFIQITKHIYSIAKNDNYYNQLRKKETLKLIQKENYYEAFIDMLFFAILEKKQPLYSSDLLEATIENILDNTSISINDLKKYLEIQFKEGISLIPSLKKLAKENNPYALYELGNLEYNGIISGTPNYNLAYKYHLEASKFNHPTSYWMLAHMILKGKVTIPNDIEVSWTYLKKAEELNSVSALNTIGLCYLSGKNPQKEKNIQKAIEYFEKASQKEYIYAYNNLGKIYEEKKDYKKAFHYYLLSANNEESWGCNKVGEFYRQGLGIEKDESKAFYYYNLGVESPIKNLYPWNIYNLVNYYYRFGNPNLGIEKNLNKCIELLNKISNEEKAQELSLYVYYELYQDTKSNKYLEKANHYLDKLNNNPNINIDIKKAIQNKLNNLKFKIN